MKRIILLSILLTAGAFFLNCGTTPPAPQPPVVSCDAQGDTPTAAYKRLYEAVKAKNTVGIKAAVTSGTLGFAEGYAAQRKITVDEVLVNGFTGSTLSPTLPELRDEQISCNMAGLEAWNPDKQVWDPLPFMIEEGKWKLAIGEMFKGSYKAPGKPMAQREAEAVNAARGNVTVPFTPDNSNTNKPKVVQIPGQTSNTTKPANK